MASSRAYHHQRLEHLADPRPPLLKTILLVLPSFAAINFIYASTWALLFSLIKTYAFLMVLGTILINAIMSW